MLHDRWLRCARACLNAHTRLADTSTSCRFKSVAQMPGELREVVVFVSRMRNARSQVGYGRALIELYREQWSGTWRGSVNDGCCTVCRWNKSASLPAVKIANLKLARLAFHSREICPGDFYFSWAFQFWWSARYFFHELFEISHEW